MASKVVPINDKVVTGAAMDQPLPKRQRNLIVLAACVLLPDPGGRRVLATGAARLARARSWICASPRSSSDLFRNDLVMRASAAPLHSVMLDAFQSGRVEEVLATDGAHVAKGDLLFRLSNPQLRLELVAREADRAQQISNLSILRVAIETSETEHQRRLLDLNFALTQARKQHARLAPLAKEGVVSAAALEESAGPRGARSPGARRRVARASTSRRASSATARSRWNAPSSGWMRASRWSTNPSKDSRCARRSPGGSRTFICS